MYSFSLSPVLCVSTQFFDPFLFLLLLRFWLKFYSDFCRSIPRIITVSKILISAIVKQDLASMGFILDPETSKVYLLQFYSIFFFFRLVLFLIYICIQGFFFVVCFHRRIRRCFFVPFLFREPFLFRILSPFPVVFYSSFLRLAFSGSIFSYLVFYVFIYTLCQRYNQSDRNSFVRLPTLFLCSFPLFLDDISF